ncbi:hypothetical protein F5890DRAFT_1477902 [Lentinula detonsa]|uniref:DNA 3'-5' helicase n=1 Tax=Lentinula detonsa TaxID=2804962 RepID=A0AA38UMU3_9AGAR|nr:hypothetical protein F5890DRAFT_1477902 [Lentinula detonsa]
MPAKAQKGRPRVKQTLLCQIFNCSFPFEGKDALDHKLSYHSTSHDIKYRGSTVQIIRRSDGKVPCPCGDEKHSRYNWRMVYRMCQSRRTGHPDPDDQTWADIPAQVSVPHLAISERDSTTSLLASGSSEHHDLDMEIDSALPVEEIRPLVEEDVVDYGKEELDMYGSDGEEEPASENEQPMDVDPGTSSFSNQPSDSTREYLAQYGIGVDPIYHLVICLECEGIADVDTIVAHRKADLARGSLKLTETRLPPSSDILDAISSLSVTKSRRPHPSEGPIVPISGVCVSDGLKCIVPGCTGKVFSGSRLMRKHQEEDHPDVPVASRLRVKVKCQALCLFHNAKRKYIEVVIKEELAFDGFEQLQKVADDCSLFAVEAIYTPVSSEREKSSVLAQTRWDELVAGVDLPALISSASPAEHAKSKPFVNLRSLAREYYKNVGSKLSDLPVLTRRAILHPQSKNPEPVPFRRPQEIASVIRDADSITQFLSFLITHHQKPLASFPIILHPEIRVALLSLYGDLCNDLPEPEVFPKFHQAVWFLLRYTSDEYKTSDIFCPFTRFLIATHIKIGGGFSKAVVITPSISRSQWSLRATAAQEIIYRAPEFDNDTLKTFRALVEPWVSESESCLFNSLRQSMHFLTALAFREQGLSRFNWSFDRQTLSMNGFPIHIPTYIQNLTQTLSTLTGQITTVFRGCPFLDILEYLDSRMIPDDLGRPSWLHEEINNDTFGYSLFAEESNGLKVFRHRLLDHLVNRSPLFGKSSGKLVAKRAHIREWFYELDEVMHGFFYVIVATWGGGARGTEMEHLLYANLPGRTRSAFLLNGLYTIFTEYSKTQSIKGHSKIVARTAAYQVNRLLILVLCCCHYAAGYIGCFVGMGKERASRYFHEIFVCSGRPMRADDFSNVLGEYNTSTMGVELKLADFRQFMACVLISSTSSGFLTLEEEDENVVAAHESFNHSVRIGRTKYGLEEVGDATSLAPDVVAGMQQVSLRWQAFLRLVHPVLHEKVSVEDKGAVTNSDATNTLIRSLFKNWTDTVGTRIDSMEQQLKLTLRGEIESLGTHLTQHLYHGDSPPSYANPNRLMVHEGVREALRCTVRGKLATWTSPEQAELVNSVGSLHHVFGILETGGGKSLAFLGAPFLMPQSGFLVIGLLVVLVDDLAPKLLEHGIHGGVWGRDNIDPSTAQLVIASAHHAGTDAFYDWVVAKPFRSRLTRIFIDEAHKILTDESYRHCFKLFWRLTEIGVPITFLSASMMPRSMPLILDSMKIHDISLVDEIRRYTGRTNLKYVVDKIENDDEILQEIRTRKEREAQKFVGGDRGIMFASTHKRTRALHELLGCPVYTGELTSSERAAATKRWKDGIQSQDRWMIATEAFGQGVDYPHVRCTIHENPKALLNWVQETGRAGRDRGTAICYTIWSELPWPIRKGDLDHQGRMEMRALLSSARCIRLSFAPLDRVAHSCVSLDGEICSNCERSAKIPYHLALQGQANFNKRLIPIDPKDSLSLLMPVSVQTNAAEVHAEREAGHDHDPSMVHNWDWMFTLYLGQLKLKHDPNANWPFCWETVQSHTNSAWKGA